MVVFDCPTGAPADTCELAYVSALAQTSATLRTDGSMDASDVAAFLQSRYSVMVTPVQVQDVILRDLATLDEHVDLMEMTTILLIPYLCKAAAIALSTTTTDQSTGTLPPGVQVPSPHVLEMVARMIVEDVAFLNNNNTNNHEAGALGNVTATSSSSPPALTVQFIQQILQAYGEDDLAADEALVQEMLQLTAGHYSSLNATALARALTADVQPLYDMAQEVRASTAEQDVWNLPKQHRTSRRQDDNDNIDDDENPILEKIFQVRKALETQSIDLMADTYRSKVLVVVLLLGVMFNYMAYIGSTEIRTGDALSCESLRNGVTWIENMAALLCAMGNSVVWWLVTYMGLSIFGMVLVGVGSLGNSPDAAPWQPLAGAAFLTLTVIIPLGLTAGSYVGRTLWILRALATLPLLIVVVMHVRHWQAIKQSQRQYSTGQHKKNAPHGGALLAEQNLKAATHYKIHRMVDNAVAIHQKSEQFVATNFGHALHVYSQWNETRSIGSVWWVWRQIYSGALFRQEGLWFSARFVTANVSQCLVALSIAVGGIIVVFVARQNLGHDTAIQVLYRILDSILSEQDEKSANLFGSSGLDCSAVSARGVDVLQEICPDFPTCQTARNAELLCALLDVPTLANSVVPESQYMLILPLSLGVISATLTALVLALSYLPSVATTTLKLRTGVIPTLTGKKFAEYRTAQVSTTLLLGSIFWGCLIASVLVGFSVFVTLFFFLYQVTSFYAQWLFTTIIGAIIVVLLRFVIMFVGRQQYFEAFYRKRPASANVYFLALDWANFALTSAFALVRFARLMIATVLSVGRIETQILVDDLERLGPLEMDPAPTIHTRQILIHEAHRHPYVEALGTFYLMKLRHGKRYCSRAGSCWRLIFVYALMPWMQKYRISGEEDEAVEDSVNDIEEPSSYSGATRRQQLVGHKSLRTHPSLWQIPQQPNPERENARLRARINQLQESVDFLREQSVSNLSEIPVKRSDVFPDETQLGDDSDDDVSPPRVNMTKKRTVVDNDPARVSSGVRFR